MAQLYYYDEYDIIFANNILFHQVEKLDLFDLDLFDLGILDDWTKTTKKKYHDWILENCTKNVYYCYDKPEFLFFKSIYDAMAFKLRWI